MSQCEHCSCNTVKNKRCCYCHEESPEEKRLANYLKNKILKVKEEEVNED